MHLKCNRRRKNGKVHRYWSVMESYRLANGKSAKRQVLYLGEINDSQKLAWRKTISVIEGDGKTTNTVRQVALFPADRDPPEQAGPGGADIDHIKVDLGAMELRRPRQWGACWLALELWSLLELDKFFTPRLPPSRKGTDWHKTLQILVAARLIKPASEWYVHREWYRQSAMADLLSLDADITPKNALYHCHDHLLEHRRDLFQHLGQRWRDLFGARFEVLLYDLTSTYFESDPPEDPATSKKRFGHSRDKRSDCVQVVIALVVTPEGYPLAYEVFAGNTQDRSTLRGFLAKIEDLYGKAERIWVMDRGIPTEEVLEEMRAGVPPVHYIVGTPKGRLTKYEKDFLGQDWQQVHPGVEVKRHEDSGEHYVLAKSAKRIGKERSMRRRRLKKLWARLKELGAMKQDRDQLLMRLGAAKKEAGRAWYLVTVNVPKAGEAAGADTFNYQLRRDKLRSVIRREGRYLLRAFVPETMPAAEIWRQYIGLTEVEESFRNLKGDLGIRPIYHQKEERIEAHIFISFLSYCLHVALRAKLRALAGGLTPRAALEKFASIQMIDVHLPAGEAGELVMPRHTQPDKDLALLLARMGLQLPPQPPPKIRKSVGETF